MRAKPKRTTARTTAITAAALMLLATGAWAYSSVNRPEVAKSKRTKAQPSFQIRASLPGELSPGRTLPVKVSLANNRPRAIWLTRMRLSLTVDPAHAAAGCSADRDYAVSQLPRKFLPYKIRKGKKPKRRRLGQKPVSRFQPLSAKKRQGKPTITMVNLGSVNQDPCKGAQLTIGFTTKSTTRKPRAKKAGGR
jgi:hypothetical protein